MGKESVQILRKRIDITNLLGTLNAALSEENHVEAISWLEQLPRYAHRVHRCMVTSEHQRVGAHVCNTRNGFIIPVTRMRSNAHAWYAYPLAGASFVVIDVPGTVLANTVVPVAYGIAAIPCSVYQKMRRAFTSPD